MNNNVFIAAIAGGSGAGKSTLVEKIRNRFANQQIAILQQDHYYRDNSHLPLADRLKLNFDHPDAIEFDLLLQHVQQLKMGQQVCIPKYSMLTCTRTGQTSCIGPSQVVLVEGILLFTHAELLQWFDLSLFLDIDEQMLFERNVERDVRERGRTPGQVRERYQATVHPMYQQYVKPSAKQAQFVFTDPDEAFFLLVDRLSKFFGYI